MKTFSVSVLAILLISVLSFAGELQKKLGEEVRDKSPVLACALSVCVPGLGQVYNGEVVKGLILAGGAFGGAALAAASASSDFSNQGSVVGISLGVGIACYVWSVIDAPISASRINSETRGRSHVTLDARLARDGVRVVVVIPF